MSDKVLRMNIGVEGNLGDGKTVTLVHELMTSVPKSKIPLANIKLVGSEYMSSHDMVQFIKDHQHDTQALWEKFGNRVWFVDEIGQMISSRTPSNPVNLLITSFITMCGKLDCDVYFSCQIPESQVDKILRSLVNIEIQCSKFYADGEPVIYGNRILEKPVLILAMKKMKLGMLGSITVPEIYDPSPYYSLYDTRELVMLDRTQFHFK